MTNEHRTEVCAMAQRLREIGMEQSNGHRLALFVLAAQLEYGSAGMIEHDDLYAPPPTGPFDPMPRAGE